MWSTIVYPSATAYPDSGKVVVWTGDRGEDLIVERSSAVEYFHGRPAKRLDSGVIRRNTQPHGLSTKQVTTFRDARRPAEHHLLGPR
jgi:hypothetical protein